MTGFGEARRVDDALSVRAEVRAVNNRHLKLVARISEPYGILEPEIERLVRQHVRRGTVQVTLRVERPRRPEDYRLNLVALSSYRDQLRSLDAGGAEPDLAALLGLPGVVEERRQATDQPHDDWPKLEPVLIEAIESFQRSRAEEGRAMADELLALVGGISESLGQVEARCPALTAGLHQRLTERVQALLDRHGLTIEPSELIREAAILAERSDISEEITRLKAHLVQYDQVIRGADVAGRKLEFVVQEMGREINTIGSKSGDIEVSRQVVEMKSRLEKVRELIQNVE